MAGAIPLTLQAATGVRPKPTSDSPIQIISIRPVSKSQFDPTRQRNRWRKAQQKSHPTIGSSPKALNAVADHDRVVVIERLRDDVVAPVALAPAAVVGANRLLSKKQRLASRLEIKPLQSGKWLHVDEGPSPVYYARARANGLFQIDTLRAWAKNTFSKSF